MLCSVSSLVGLQNAIEGCVFELFNSQMLEVPYVGLVKT